MSAGDSASDDAEGGTSRAAFRAFVRGHHPDVGGDPDEFMAGLAEFRRLGVIGDAAAREVAREMAEDSGSYADHRYDAPVSFVVNPKGVARVREWRRRRRRPPRVR
ncbi:hypothetical protein [Amycolatopsis sp. H20-H5]|uniref:hypothetical protein n=1 Tax=Amycolatopsis sp. H20-H5 TaxID=3046309 RepID=UPI002DBAED40|nr:hypothetical protein [Amycolatopsis sp. H20-H5]MEC3981093.1 hypothetical protein [Amycolatopsis sp. H20-H5]